MHTATKVMLILGGVITVIGIVMFVGGAAGMDFDPMNDNLYEGKSGEFDGDADVWFGVYSESSCDSASVSIVDEAGDDMIYDWECSTDEELGLTYVGGWIGDGAQTYTVTSNVDVAIADEGEYLGEAVGGFFAMVGSFGVLCCGGFFLLLGGIFALTLKDKGDTVVVVQGGAQQPMMAATGMAAPQYEQPVQYQQPPQGGM
jgi:hypothetical protein